MECWGGAGGNYLAGSKHANYPYYGKGGYVSGILKITLNMPSEFYVYVGGVGATPTECALGAIAPDAAGGWNGGGIGRGEHTDDEACGGGGGATDIRITKTSNATTWKETVSLRTRIIVAGGAGGQGRQDSRTGFAGGLWGLAPTIDNGNDAGATIAKQNTGYAFGYGQDGTYNNANACTAGGGGGWYGGGTAQINTTYPEQGAAGGSSFISGHPGCNAINPNTGAHLGASTKMTINSNEYSFSSTVMIDGKGYQWTTASQTSSSSSKLMPNPATASSNYSSGQGNTGNGYARITCKPYD